jgi:hypothetical protein
MTLSDTEVEKYLDLQELLDGLEDGFRGLELGEVQSPPRPQPSVAGKGFSLAMPARRPGVRSRHWRYLLHHGWDVNGYQDRRVCDSFSPHAEPERFSAVLGLLR